MKQRTRRRLARITATAAAAVAVSLGAGTHLHRPAPAAPEPSSTGAVSAPASDVATLLAQIPTTATVTAVDGYDRSCANGHRCVFGPAWNSPLDHSGCDTKSRVLSAQLHDVQYKPGTHDCKVVAGWVDDPYTGTRITLHDISIDHVVPLRYAWDAGAWQWTPRQRAIFANDPDNLLAVSAHENSSKQDDSLAQWLPPVGQCGYVLRFLAVAAKYQLAMAPADRDAAAVACTARA
ncbi:MAG: HNH endonuclease family protein [Mycolicibacterium sp.]|uniref:HNH endonuclease family protein n=1 Tax=Mycolicibacterium sp. TaxID=2320850 RepID=UPI003D0A7971